MPRYAVGGQLVSSLDERFLHRRTGSDGVEGEVDLTDLSGKGVFTLWNDYKNFEKVYIGKFGQIAWTNEIDMCPDSLYMRLTGKTPEEVFPKLREMSIDP